MWEPGCLQGVPAVSLAHPASEQDEQGASGPAQPWAQALCGTDLLVFPGSSSVPHFSQPPHLTTAPGGPMAEPHPRRGQTECPVSLSLPANHLKPSAPSPHLRAHPGPNPRHPRQPPNPAGPAAVAAHLGLDLPPEGDPIVLQTRERSWLQAARKGSLSQPGNRGTQRGCAQAHQTCLAAGLGRRCREELQHKAPG